MLLVHATAAQPSLNNALLNWMASALIILTVWVVRTIPGWESKLQKCLSVGPGNPAEGAKEGGLRLYFRIPHEWGCGLNHRQGGRHVRGNNVWSALETDEAKPKRVDFKSTRVHFHCVWWIWATVSSDLEEFISRLFFQPYLVHLWESYFCRFLIISLSVPSLRNDRRFSQRRVFCIPAITLLSSLPWALRRARVLTEGLLSRA